MEKDIEILEEMKKSLWEYFEDFKIDKDTSSTMKKIYEIRKAQAQALENLIKGYRELEEQIDKHVYFETTNPKEIEKNFIPKSKVKEKIQELEKEYKKIEETSDFIIADIIQPKIQALQELMEDK